MPRIPITSLDDPRVAPYRQLKGSDVMRRGELFVAEGNKVVERLLESDFETVSVLLSEKREAAWGPKVPADVPVYVIPQELGASKHLGARGPSPAAEHVPDSRKHHDGSRFQDLRHVPSARIGA